MKKIVIFAVFIALVTLAGFWAGRQCCLFVCSAREPAAGSSFRGEADALCVKICDRRLELVDLMRADAPDRALLNARIEEIGALQTSLEKRIAAHMLDLKKRLTPEEGRAYLARIHKELRRSIEQGEYGEAVKQKEK